jgi:hypothetical protein
MMIKYSLYVRERKAFFTITFYIHTQKKFLIRCCGAAQNIGWSGTASDGEKTPDAAPAHAIIFSFYYESATLKDFLFLN